MESVLEETQATVASLRALLQGGEPTLPVEYRSLPGLRAIAIRGTVEWDDTHHWLVGALTELYGALAARPDARCGPDAALYSPEFFEAHTGEVIAYVPVTADLPVTGRAERAIGADGPIREHYLVSVADDPAELRTEVAWPVSVTIPAGEGPRW